MSMVRKAATLFGGVALALSLATLPSAQPASAQSGGITWTTGFQVQNLGTGAATVTIELINQDGTTNATISNESIGVGGSKSYYPVPSNGTFNGSAVISSTQPVASILNVLGNAGTQPYYSEAASGIPAADTATSVSLPLIMRGNGGFNTWFAVQNAGSADASVTVTYKTGGAFGNDFTAPAKTIKAGASAIFDQATESGIGTKFVGSATVTSSQPLAVVVNQVGSGGIKVALIYSGFAAGSTSVALPLVMQANAGYYTGISIQNVGSTAANVTVSYSQNLVAGGAALADSKLTIDPGKGGVVTVGGTSKYVGSATVTSDQPVVVVVNQLSATNGTAYEGIPLSKATSSVSLPLLMDKNGGFYTAVQCRNVGSATTTVTLTYSANQVSGGVNPSPASVANVAPGGTANIGQGFVSKYVGSGTITTSPASNIVCIVNELNPTPNAGDAFLTYDGINF